MKSESALSLEKIFPCHEIGWQNLLSYYDEPETGFCHRVTIGIGNVTASIIGRLHATIPCVVERLCIGSPFVKVFSPSIFF
jgi:hypothetical protein